MNISAEIWKRLPLELRAEISENMARKDLTPSEMDAARRLLEPHVEDLAKQRQRLGGQLKAGGKLPPPEKVKTRDVVGQMLGTSGRNLDKIAAVVDAANVDHGRFGTLLDIMNRQGKVHDAHRRLRVERDKDRRDRLGPIEGHFNALIFDPPYEYGNDVAGRSKPDYATMDNEKLLAMASQVRAWAEDNSHCYLWSPPAVLPFAFQLMAAFGFDYKMLLTWHKPRFGLGVYFRNQTEHVLFGTRGRLDTRECLPNIFGGAMGKHSAKPDEFYELVRRVSYPPYGEGFQRTQRPDFVNLYIDKDESGRDA